jgi:threonine/homoserine/homoserine lactone efflux protein
LKIRTTGRYPVCKEYLSFFLRPARYFYVGGHYLLQGIVLGLSIAAPIGPIGVLCVRRTLEGGWTAGFVSGLGAATADGCYAIVIACGLTAVSDLVIGHAFLLRVLGGLLLFFLGLLTFFSSPGNGSGMSGKSNLFRDYTTTFFLTLTNPMTILFFAGAFAVLGVGSTEGGIIPSILAVTGVVTGSVLWWILLVSGAASFSSGCHPGRLVLVNRIAGTVIACFGILAMSGVLM